jgi:lauroyl/myristoyl acyltransferase
MRTARKIRYRLEWLALKSATKFLPLLSRKACYRLALLLGSLGAMLDRRGRRVALSNLRMAFGGFPLRGRLVTAARWRIRALAPGSELG